MEKLRKALGTLEHTYTRDDGEVNFVITLMPSAIFEHDGQEVIDAWGTVRDWLRTAMPNDDDADRKADEAVARQRQIFDEANRKADAAEQQVSDAMQQQYDRNQGR